MLMPLKLALFRVLFEAMPLSVHLGCHGDHAFIPQANFFLYLTISVIYWLLPKLVFLSVASFSGGIGGIWPRRPLPQLHLGHEDELHVD